MKASRTSRRKVAIEKGRMFVLRPKGFERQSTQWTLSLMNDKTHHVKLDLRDTFIGGNHNGK